MQALHWAPCLPHALAVSSRTQFWAASQQPSAQLVALQRDSHAPAALHTLSKPWDWQSLHVAPLSPHFWSVLPTQQTPYWSQHPSEQLLASQLWPHETATDPATSRPTA